MNQLPRGTTEECLRDLFKRFPWGQLQALLAEFVQVEKATVRRWRSEENTPKGDALLRVRVFLDLLGYQVAEFQELPDVVRQFARLIAFDILSVKDAKSELDYRREKGVYDVVLRGAGLFPHREYRLSALVGTAKEQLKSKMTELRKKLAELEGSEDSPTAEGSEAEGEVPPLGGPAPFNNALSTTPVVGSEAAVAIIVYLLRATYQQFVSLHARPDARELLAQIGSAFEDEELLALWELLERLTE